MKWLRIWRLQCREVWLGILIDVEQGRILDAGRNLAEAEKRMARTRFELDAMYAPQSLIIQALRRMSK